MKMRVPKSPRIKRPLTGGHQAFGGGGGVHAFRDPGSMVAPDQAFSAAMSKTGAAPGGPAIGGAPSTGASPGSSSSTG